jgi:phosphoglycerate-specific signal transduction histidine kinase
MINGVTVVNIILNNTSTPSKCCSHGSLSLYNSSKCHYQSKITLNQNFPKYFLKYFIEFHTLISHFNTIFKTIQYISQAISLVKKD